MIIKADSGEVTRAEHYALREFKPKSDMEREYTRGFESAVETMKALVSGRIKAYTEHGLVGPERLEAFRTVMDEDIAVMERTVKALRGMA